MSQALGNQNACGRAARESREGRERAREREMGEVRSSRSETARALDVPVAHDCVAPGRYKGDELLLGSGQSEKRTTAGIF